MVLVKEDIMSDLKELEEYERVLQGIWDRCENYLDKIENRMIKIGESLDTVQMEIAYEKEYGEVRKDEKEEGKEV
jgi:hypothetical protein